MTMARRVLRAAVAVAAVSLVLAFTTIQEVWSIAAFMVCFTLLLVSATIAILAWDECEMESLSASDGTEVHAAQ